MRVVVINGTTLESMEEAHLQIRKQGRFPGYYGKNLDALYDLLSTEDRKTLILFFDSQGFVQRMGKKGERLVTTFQEVDLENQQIRFIRIARKGMLSKGFVV